MATGSMILIGALFLVLAILLTVPTMRERKLKSIIDVFSEGITSVSFLVIFIVFMSQIVARYFFNTSIGWANEVSILGYMFCMYFGTGLAITRDEHVVFSLIYDKLSPRGQLISKLLYNTAMIVLLALTVVPTSKVIFGMKNVTGVLKLPYPVVFAPYVWMLCETIVRCAVYMKTSVDEYRGIVAEAKKEVKA